MSRTHDLHFDEAGPGASDDAMRPSFHTFVAHGSRRHARKVNR